MTPHLNLTTEQTQAIAAAGDDGASFIDPTTNRKYAVLPMDGGGIIDVLTMAKRLVERMGSVESARAALQELEKCNQDVASIGRGIADMEAGRHSSVEDAFNEIESHLIAKYGE